MPLLFRIYYYLKKIKKTTTLVNIIRIKKYEKNIEIFPLAIGLFF